MGSLSMPERAGHSAVVYGDSIFVFGGKDDDNNKLTDLWEFNLNTYHWNEIKVDEPPLARSGHSASIYKEFMIVFGGIHEVTKELDDMIMYDFKNRRWIQFFEELISPVKRNISHSPSLSKNGGTSPQNK